MSKHVTNIGWDDVPHLTAKAKEELMSAYKPHEADARSKGIPSLGAGAIYPIKDTDIMVSPFALPAIWPRVYAMDVGWKRTAALWGAVDIESGTTYVYAEYYRGQAEPVIHADGIKSPGDWIPGVIDPASRGRSQKDGIALFDEYRKLGLDLVPADNSVSTGIGEVWTALSTGRVKIFSSLSNFFFEFRLYRRDENGKIVKEHDHLMDCLRYLVMTGIKVARIKDPVRQQNIGYDPLTRFQAQEKQRKRYDPFAP